MVIELRTRARIGAHVIWDHLTRPMAVGGEDVPWSADAMTPAWLTSVLCTNVPGAKVEDVVISDGHEGSSVRRRVEVRYNAPGTAVGLPRALFVKCTPTLLTRLTSGMSAAAEAGFYRHVRHDIPGIEVPRHHHSACDRRSGRSVHLFDDLVVTDDAMFCSFSTRVDHHEAEQMVDTLAALHATFLGSTRLDGDLGWIPTYESFVRIGERNGTRQGHDAAMDCAADVVPADVLRRRDEIWPMLMRGLAVLRTEPRTVLHNDVHLGNWYVTGDGRVGLCDWQCVSSGHWARDVAYAIATVLSVENRREWERDLLARYLERLQSRCAVQVTFDDAWNRYRQQLFGALLMWTPTLCHPPTMPDMQPVEMSRLMIERITTAISDLDALDSQDDR